VRTTLGTLFLACCVVLAGCQSTGKQGKTASRPGGGAPDFVGAPAAPKDEGGGEGGGGAATTASAPKPKKGTLAGMVLDPYNRAKPGALVHLVEMGAKDRKAPLQVLVNKAGCFEVQNLPYGKKYQLRAEVQEGGRLLSGTTTASVPSSRVAIYLLQEESAPAEKGPAEKGAGGAPPPASIGDDTPAPAGRSVPDAGAEAGGAGTTTPSSISPPAGVTDVPPKVTTGDPSLLAETNPDRGKAGEIPALPPTVNVPGPGGRSHKPEKRDAPYSAPTAPPRFPGLDGLQPSAAPSASPSAAPSADPGSAALAPLEKKPGRLVVPSCVRIGNTVQSFALYDKDGQAREYRAPFKSKLILLDFWFGDCAPCREVIGKLNSWHKKYDGHGLEIVGVNCEPFTTTLAEKKDALKKALAKHRLRIDYTELLSGGGKGDCPMVKQMVDGEFPTLVLLDQNGKVIYRLTSSNAAALNRLDWVIYNKLFPGRTTASVSQLGHAGR